MDSTSDRRRLRTRLMPFLCLFLLIDRVEILQRDGLDKPMAVMYDLTYREKRRARNGGNAMASLTAKRHG